MKKINTDLMVEKINKALIEADKKLEQLELVNDILSKMVELINQTNKFDYETSYEEERKIYQIKIAADTILKNIGG